jgi:hypothetical protein
MSNNPEQILFDLVQDSLAPAPRAYRATRTLGRFTKALGRTAKKAVKATSNAVASTAKEAKQGLSDGWNS